MPARGRGSDAAPGPQRVFLHIGPPKTGTSFVQSVLWTNKRGLHGADVLVAGDARSAHFDAAGDLRGTFRRGLRSRKHGAWDRLAKVVREWPETSVISCEWLAFCDDDEMRRAVRSFGDVEVHVVLTLRDLGRVVPAVWQERIKNGHYRTMAHFLDQIANPDDGYGAVFWRVHDARRLVDLWGSEVPEERVHLVTVPRSPVVPDELWRRFGSLFVADPHKYDTSQVRANLGLHPAEAELLRRVNTELDGRMTKSAHHPLVKNYLAGELTKRGGGSGKVQLPPDAMATVARRGEEVIADLRGRRCRVVGDLEDLRVDTSAVSGSLPEASSEVEVAQAAVRSMAALLLTMQADNAHRRQVWRKPGGGGADRVADRGGDPAAEQAAPPRLARRAAGRLRRAAGRLRRAAGRLRRAAGRLRRAARS